MNVCSLYSRSRACTLRPTVRPLDQPVAPGDEDEWEEIVNSGLLDDEPRARVSADAEVVDVNAEDGADDL